MGHPQKLETFTSAVWKGWPPVARSTRKFHKRLSLAGVILTKLDGDAPGGIELSTNGEPYQGEGLG